MQPREDGVNPHGLYERMTISSSFSLRMHERPFNAAVRHGSRNGGVDIYMQSSGIAIYT